MKLDAVIYISQPDSPRNHAKWMADGLRRHGVSVEFRRSTMYRRSDLAIFWAHKQTQIMQQQRAAGLDYLVMERGYFGDRFEMTSLGFNGLNGHAEFHAHKMPSDRWAKHGVEVKPWRTGDYGLIMGQVPTDASLRTCHSYPAWVKEAARLLRESYGMRVYFRPHPHPSASRFRPDLMTMRGTLQEALEGAAYVCLWNSNSGVDAALAGVPVIACDRGAMSYPIATRFIGQPLVTPDRTQWLNDLAYCQWTPNEIERGEAWEHLSRRFEHAKTAA